MPDTSTDAATRGARIEVSGLTKTFGSLRAVDDLSFSAEPGTITGFLGPNGAGKTTTLRMLLGLVRPTAGAATIGGVPYAGMVDPIRVVGAALEATGFHPARNGREHLRVYCTVTGLPRARADDVLGQVGLADAGGRRVGAYSLGMRQRLALATALLGDPTVLVLDEPANGLDPEGIAWMRRFLRGLADEGRTVLLSSHVLSEVQQLVDDVVILNRGRLVHQGALSELAVNQPGALVTAPRPDELVAALTGAGHGVTGIVRTGPSTLTISGIPTAEIGRLAWQEHIEVHELTPLRSGLEEAFLTLTSASPEEG